MILMLTICQQTNSWSIKSQTSQLVEMLDGKFGVYTVIALKCDFRQTALFVHCHYSLVFGLGLLLDVV